MMTILNFIIHWYKACVDEIKTQTNRQTVMLRRHSSLTKWLEGELSIVIQFDSRITHVSTLKGGGLILNMIFVHQC